MSFVTKVWKDRLVEYAGRRKLRNVATGETAIYDVERNEGTVSQAGDAFNAANMNNLEQRIKNEFDAISKSFLDGCSKIAAAITSNGVSTAANATPTVMATNIGKVATNKYNAGYAAGSATGLKQFSKSITVSIGNTTGIERRAANIAFSSSELGGATSIKNATARVTSTNGIIAVPGISVDGISGLTVNAWAYANGGNGSSVVVTFTVFC